MSIAPTDGPDNALELVGVGRRYSTPAEEIWAVSGVSLTVEFGSFVALMGASGSGKSTLLSLCAGLDDATTGRINVMGAVLAELSQAERADLRLASLGVVFQDHNLIEQLTALENVALPMEALGMGRSAARQAAATALANCGVGELAARYPGELSGGQQQRVGIARAIVGNRRVLLADEPTGALDSENTRQLFDLIRTRCDHGLAAVVATHDESVAQFADQVVRIADGEVLDVSAARA